MIVLSIPLAACQPIGERGQINLSAKNRVNYLPDMASMVRRPLRATHQAGSNARVAPLVTDTRKNREQLLPPKIKHNYVTVYARDVVHTDPRPVQLNPGVQPPQQYSRIPYSMYFRGPAGDGNDALFNDWARRQQVPEAQREEFSATPPPPPRGVLSPDQLSPIDLNTPTPPLPGPPADPTGIATPAPVVVTSPVVVSQRNSPQAPVSTIIGPPPPPPLPPLPAQPPTPPANPAPAQVNIPSVIPNNPTPGTQVSPDPNNTPPGSTHSATPPPPNQQFENDLQDLLQWLEERWGPRPPPATNPHNSPVAGTPRNSPPPTDRPASAQLSPQPAYFTPPAYDDSNRPQYVQTPPAHIFHPVWIPA